MAPLLALLLSIADSSVPNKVTGQAEARILILRPHKASRESWDPAARPNQREIVKKEKDGSQNRLRLTEFE